MEAAGNTAGTLFDRGFYPGAAAGAGKSEKVSAAGQAQQQTRSTQQSAGFSGALADALENEMMNTVLTAANPASAAGLSSSLSQASFNTGGIEPLILASAASGQASGAQSALLMLCMMMQTGGSGGDSSILMQMMASMLTQIQGESGSPREGGMPSGYDPYFLDTVDFNVFGTQLPQVTGTGAAVLPTEFWRPTTPAVTSAEGQRSPELYSRVISQFRVETAERYEPFRNGSTYCNIYVWDVTAAMGAEVPHYTDPNTGEALSYPNTEGAKSMTAESMDAWLKRYGYAYGWRRVDAETAQRYANEGKPAVASGGSMDHIQIVCPSRDGAFDPARGVTVAQAGRIVTSYTHITDIYGGSALDEVSYFVHE